MDMILEDQAVAKLVMRSGNVVSAIEAEDLISTYGYVMDTVDPNRYNLASDDDASIVLSEDLETLDVYGSARDHLDNINFIIQKLGWSSIDVCCEAEVATFLLERLSGVDIEKHAVIGEPSHTANRSVDDSNSGDADFSPDDPGSSFESRSGTLEPEHAVIAYPNDSQVISESLMEDHQRIQEYIVQLANACEENDRLRAELSVAGSRINTLEMQLQTQSSNRPLTSSVTQAGAAPLIRFVEKHLSSMVDLNASFDSGVLADLNEAGFGVELKLVPFVR